MRYVLCYDCKTSIPAQAMKLRKITNISTAIMCRKISFTNAIQSVLNYARSFEEYYAASFVDARVLDIIDNMMPSNFLDVNSEAIYVRYICVAKMMIENKRVLLLLVSHDRDAPRVKTLRIIHLDDPGLYISTE